MLFSDYVIFVDESGDHSLASIDPDFPLFVLVFCIFEKSDYVGNALPMIARFKFEYWGHDLVILHSHEIRKEANRFTILVEANLRNRFLGGLGELVEKCPFTVVMAIIDKKKLQDENPDLPNPY